MSQMLKRIIIIEVKTTKKWRERWINLPKKVRLPQIINNYTDTTFET